MRLTHGLHLAYCTNVHRGENWPETLESLEQHCLAVRRRVAPDRSFAIGLRLSDRASLELARPEALAGFSAWLERNHCYVFTINGFPFGDFHGRRVKEQVTQPDWTSAERLKYTLRLFDILAALVPEGGEGSVSTAPVSFKQFNLGPRAWETARRRLWEVAEHVADLSRRRGLTLHLGLEPEPFGSIENTAESLELFERLASDRPGDPRVREHIGINYDTCHFAIQWESPDAALKQFEEAGVRISKLHLSNALSLKPTPAAREWLRRWIDGVYFHQVIERGADGRLTRYPDLEDALAAAESTPPAADAVWRVHFHIPLDTPRSDLFSPTSDHLLGTLDYLQRRPGLCRHLEMETYTWEVLPAELKAATVDEMLAREYNWTLAQLSQRGFCAPD